VRFAAAAVVVLAVLAPAPSLAERADSQKPVNVEADKLTADDAKQTAVFEGRVVVTQGTRVLRADKVTIRQDGEGFSHAIAEGKPATFREKREGTDEWVDGEAQRIEYDGKRELVELFNSARLTRNKDEIRGNYISYDQKADVFLVKGGKDAGGAGSRDARVRAVIQPKPKNGEGAPAAPPLELKRSSATSAAR
jgi:lipopolysaccharide export system protein LptA